MGSVPTSNQPITIIHREDGSSSTSGITSYLSEACPDVWTGGAKKTPDDFGVDATYALPQQGSGNVANAIAANQYSIGYIDAGHGHELGFQEISLTNKHGQKLTSKEANIPKAATAYGTLPDIDGDWSDVSLINLDGEDVWPITAISYIYVRTNLTGEVGRLVKSFVLYCLSDEGQDMLPDFLFFPLSDATKNSMREQVNAKLSTTAWTFELASATQAIDGMNSTVFSGKRKSYGDYERELLVSKVDALESSVADLQSMESIPVHGSGTTNPSKFFWKLMDVLEERSRIHLSMSYRAVGSGTGIKEFVGATNDYEPYSHFGSGDIVVPSEDYTALNDRDKGFVTIPFQLGTISFFHNVPGVPDGSALDLKPCILAKIFTRKITTWDHADILDSNPGFSPPAGQAITVVRRIYGSSSTSLISQYLYKSCPSVWNIGVGKGGADSSNPTVPTKAPFWPSDTVGAEGSGGVSDTISSTEYSIGYIESGHGQALSLAEVALQNKDGNYLTAAEAEIGSAVTQIMSSIPNADGDWDNDNLSLLDLGGANTWPITAFSFMFIRKDLTSLGRSGPAVKAFAEMVLSTEGQGMLPQFGANAVPDAIIAKGIAGLAQLKFAATSTMFGGFGGFGGMNQEPETPKGDAVQMDLYVSLKDLYLGNTIKVIRDKDVLKPAKGTRKCNCRQKMVTRQVGPGMFQQYAQNECEECPNVKLAREKSTLMCEIEPGMEDGREILFFEEGDVLIDGEPGDLKMIVKAQYDKEMKWRRGASDNNLYMDKEITLVMALNGFETEITHYDGRKIVLKNEEVTTPGFVQTYKGEGMPRFGKSGKFGDLVVTYSIKFPKKVPKGSKQIVKDIFSSDFVDF